MTVRIFLNDEKETKLSCKNASLRIDQAVMRATGVSGSKIVVPIASVLYTIEDKD